jgi:hypothetical protein
MAGLRRINAGWRTAPALAQVRMAIKTTPIAAKFNLRRQPKLRRFSDSVLALLSRSDRLR